MRKHIVVLWLVFLVPTESSHRKYTYKSWPTLRIANWSSLLPEPSAFVAKSHARLRSREEGYKPGSRCAKYVGMAYLDHIKESRQTICSTATAASQRRLSSTGLRKRDLAEAAELPSSQSSVDCFTAPYVPVGFSNKASISLCHSRNLVLNSCSFFAARRKGTLNKKFPMPATGAVQLACDMANVTKLVEEDSSRQWLKSIHHEVWWANASRDDEAVRRSCDPNSSSLVTTPTLFVMRDRHANYAHEMEVVSMAFSFLAALEPGDVASKGIQVVIVDQAPPTGFLETWARMSHPHRLRILAHDPYPPGTCFRSAYHVYTFAAGIGYNTNADTVRCESPVVTGLSHWLRQLYEERDPVLPADAHVTAATAAAATAGPYTAAAGVRGLRAPTAGIIVKNVVWLSRRNLEVVRLLLNASVGWKSMRLVRNEDEVVAGLLAAVQEWNAESCLLQQFNRVVQAEYEKSLSTVHAVHLGPGDDAAAMAVAAARAKTRRRGTRENGKPVVRRPAAADEVTNADRPGQAPSGTAVGAPAVAEGQERGAQDPARRQLLANQGGGDIDEHGNDEDGGEVQGAGGSSTAETATAAAAAAANGSAALSAGNATGDSSSSPLPGQVAGASGSNPTDAPRASTAPTTSGYMLGTNTILLDKLWDQDPNARNCRRTNVLFSFVDGDFNDMPYHQQLKTIFRTGVLVGVHGAGLTHGFFMPPGQSAVLQLLGESFAKVAANNVFRNMAAGVGNHYEDVLYAGVDVNVEVLKAAVKRAMDFVASQVMETQVKHTGGSLPLVLDDQNHFSVIVPSTEQCPRNRTMRLMSRQSRK